MDIIANNRIIADFMGGKPSHPIAQNDDYWLPIHGIVNCNTIELGRGKIMKYHKSWDWLMPVVEKIENMNKEFTSKPQFKLESGFVRLSACIGYRDNRLNINYTYSDYVGFGGLVRARNKFDFKTKKEAIYNAVVEFIKWYNKKSSE